MPKRAVSSERSTMPRISTAHCSLLPRWSPPMTRVVGPLLLSLLTLAPARAVEPVALFDGKDLGKWYTFLRDHGKDKDPNGTFTVKDGVLRISGQDFGGLITRDEYADYKLETE